MCISSVEPVSDWTGHVSAAHSPTWLVLIILYSKGLNYYFFFPSITYEVLVDI